MALPAKLVMTPPFFVSQNFPRGVGHDGHDKYLLH